MNKTSLLVLLTITATAQATDETAQLLSKLPSETKAATVRKWVQTRVDGIAVDCKSTPDLSRRLYSHPLLGATFG